MYAIVESGGRQVKVEPDGVVAVDHLGGAIGEPVTFDRVLLVASDDGQVQAGTPHVDGARVTGVVDGDAQGNKVRVFIKKRRKGMRRTIGHRARFTRVRITGIEVPSGT